MVSSVVATDTNNVRRLLLGEGILYRGMIFRNPISISLGLPAVALEYCSINVDNVSLYSC